MPKFTFRVACEAALLLVGFLCVVYGAVAIVQFAAIVAGR